MAGSVKLNVYDKHLPLAPSAVITVDTCSLPVDVRGINDGVMKVVYSAYDGATGVIKVQVNSAQHEDDLVEAEWLDWGGANAQGVMGSASGSCEFHIWQFAPTFIRACVALGDGTTATVTTSFGAGYG